MAKKNQPATEEPTRHKFTNEIKREAVPMMIDGYYASSVTENQRPSPLRLDPVWLGTGEGDGFTAYRMSQRQLRCMKSHRRVCSRGCFERLHSGELLSRQVHRITENRHAQMPQVQSNLVGPSCLWHRFDQRGAMVLHTHDAKIRNSC